METLNFYRRFISGVAKDQTMLHNVLRELKINEKTPVEWTPLLRFFKIAKIVLQKYTSGAFDHDYIDHWPLT